jgi:superfamily II DNA/RNA helicase
MLNFSEALPPILCEVLYQCGYTKPLPVQSQCVPIALAGFDFVGLSQPGTGKTLAYVIPLVVRILRSLETTPFDPRDGPLAVVLLPTHELADQVATVVDQICRPLDLLSFSLIGGFSIHDQARTLATGFHLLVATPGRLNDVLENRLMVLAQCYSAVIDEADKMADRSLEPQIAKIFGEMPTDRKLMMFSATMPHGVLSFLEQLFPNLVRVRVGAVGDASEKISQIVHYVTKSARKQLFLDCMHVMKPPIIVFANSRETCEEIGNLLGYTGFRVASLHGGKSQKDREAVINALIDKLIDIIVATDVLSRGIDIEQVQHVVNYEVPAEISTYVHRIGRTGRAGAAGTATSFVTPDDRAIMYDLTRLLQRNGFVVPDAMLGNSASSHRVETEDASRVDS